MSSENIRVLVLLTSALFAGITCFIIYFIVLYRNKQLINKQEQEQLQSAFRQELLKAQIEMQEQTLEYISKEIHDNITQVLSFVKLNLGMIKNKDDITEKKINETRELISQTINDLRNLSKSLSFEHIVSYGLIRTIKLEIERINNSGLIDASFVVEGEGYSLGEQHELVLFRIFQEALNNALKYSNAKHLKIGLQYYPELFNLTVEDDGVGFTTELLHQQGGSGLRNMQNRATLIGAVAIIDSAPGKGCYIKVTLNPLKLRLYTDGILSDRVS